MTTASLPEDDLDLLLQDWGEALVWRTVSQVFVPASLTVSELATDREIRGVVSALPVSPVGLAAGEVLREAKSFLLRLSDLPANPFSSPVRLVHRSLEYRLRSWTISSGGAFCLCVGVRGGAG